MKAIMLKLTCLTAAFASAVLTAGCGEVSRTGRSPVQVVIESLTAASGAEDTTFLSFLLSDVSHLTEDGTETFFNDPGQVTMRIILRDPGAPGIPSAPTLLNEVTITRYRVVYVRADGRNTPGVDVPFPFDQAVTFTIPTDSTATHGFNLVRHTAKLEAPLARLRDQLVIISTIAEVTFYGHDQAGNEVSATARINVEFGNFADPE